MIADARRFDMDAAAIASLEAALSTPEETGDDDGLWPCHVTVAAAFAIVSTQWRVAVGLSRMLVVGLDYAGARAGIECAGIVITPELWSDLRVMEIAAVEELNRTEG